MDREKPDTHNQYQWQHIRRLLRSYEHWLGQALLPLEKGQVDQRNGSSEPEAGMATAKAVFEAPFALVSHDLAHESAEPVFNYGNQTALRLFAMSWEAFVQLPSRQSAEPMNQSERAHLLRQVSTHGFIDHYEGIRIAATGQRFIIRNAVVWNVLDAQGQYAGQAAVFHQWQFL